MPTDIPAYEPASFVAGDTVKWIKDVPAYSAAEGWTLTYAFRGEKGDGYLNVTALPQAAQHAITIAAAETAKMRPGIWVWDAYVQSSSLLERYTVGHGQMTVKPNLAATDFVTDLRSEAKQAYDNAMAAWKRVQLGQTVSLNGRVWTQANLNDLIAYVDKCRTDWTLEQQAQQPVGVDGGGDPRKIKVRFVEP